MAERDEFLMEIRERLHQAQQHYKTVYDGKHCEVLFEVGLWVCLWLVHRPMTSLNVTDCSKLGPKFYGPFRISEKINEVAYRLELPLGAKLHNVFHVGLLKKFNGGTPRTPGWIQPIRHGRACLEPEAVTKSHLARGQVELLVNWKGRANIDASWIPVMEF
jgi:hypothetical protein